MARPVKKIQMNPQSGIEEKWCNSCEQWKPATLDFFGVDNTRPHSLSIYCLECRNRKGRMASKKYYEKERRERLDELGGACADCGEIDERVLLIVGDEILCANCRARRN